MLVAGACSSSSDSSSEQTDDTSGGASGSETFAEPLNIGTLWEIKGESAVAINDYEYGAQLALEEINAAGGVGGKPVEMFRVATSPLDFQKTQASFLEAVDKDPSVIVGFALPAQLQATAQQITRSEIPVLATTNGQPFLRFGAQDGSEFVWNVKAYDPGIVQFGIDYVVEELKLDKVGLMATNESNGSEAVTAAEAALGELGLKPTAVAQYPPTQTDLTAQVNQMSGSNAVMHWGFPNTLPVQLNQFLANGLDIPTLGNDSAGIAVASGAVTGPAISKLYTSSSCNPGAPLTPTAETFNKNYEAKFNVKPSVSSAIAYDGIYLAAEAARTAGSTDPVDINKAIADITLPDGVCGNYKADGAHMLNHQVVISKYAADSTSEIVKSGIIPDQDAQ